MSAGSTVGVHEPSVWVSDKHRLTERVLTELAKLFFREPDCTSLQLHLIICVNQLLCPFLTGAMRDSIHARRTTQVALGLTWVASNSLE